MHRRERSARRSKPGHCAKHLRIASRVQLKERKTGRELMQTAGCPVVMTADCNMRPDAPGYAELCTWFRDANTQGDPTRTWHNYSNMPISILDYIFTSPGLDAAGYRVLTEKPGDMFVSDHYGLFAVLQFP